MRSLRWCTLIEGSGLTEVRVLEPATSMQGSNDPQGCPVAGGGKAARIADGEHPGFVGPCASPLDGLHQCICPMLPDALQILKHQSAASLISGHLVDGLQSDIWAAMATASSRTCKITNLIFRSPSWQRTFGKERG